MWWRHISFHFRIRICIKEAFYGHCITCGTLRAHLYFHYRDVIMSTIASQITSLGIVYLTVYSGADQRKHQSSASLAFVRGIHRWPVNSPHKWPVTRKVFPFDDVIMWSTPLDWSLWCGDNKTLETIVGINLSWYSEYSLTTFWTPRYCSFRGLTMKLKPPPNEVSWEHTGFTLSVHLSVMAYGA